MFLSIVTNRLEKTQGGIIRTHLMHHASDVFTAFIGAKRFTCYIRVSKIHFIISEKSTEGLSTLNCCKQ
jgi:hypothetical protein